MKSKGQMAEDIKRFVEYAIDGLHPIVECANKAREVFDMRPCVLTGSRRHDAEEAMRKSISATRKMLWNKWKQEFKPYVSAKDYCEMIEDSTMRLFNKGV